MSLFAILRLSLFAPQTALQSTLAAHMSKAHQCANSILPVTIPHPWHRSSGNTANKLSAGYAPAAAEMLQCMDTMGPGSPLTEQLSSTPLEHQLHKLSPDDGLSNFTTNKLHLAQPESSGYNCRHTHHLHTVKPRLQPAPFRHLLHPLPSQPCLQPQ